MANQLTMAKIESILALREQGWSCRRIARELDHHQLCRGIQSLSQWHRCAPLQSAIDTVSPPRELLA